MQQFNQQDQTENILENQFQIQHSNKLLDQLEKKMQKHFQKRTQQYVNTQYQDKSKDYFEEPSDRFLITSNYRKIQQYPNDHEASKSIAKVSLEMMLNPNQQKLKSSKKISFQPQFPQQYKNSINKLNASTKKQFYNSSKELEQIQEVTRQKGIDKQGSFKLFKRKKQQHIQNLQKIQNVGEQKSFRQAESFPRILEGQLKSFSLNDYLSRHLDNHPHQAINNKISVQPQSLLAHKHYKSVQALLNNKLKMKEATIEHLENQLRIGNQERVHHYKINLQLEQQYKQLLENQQAYEKQVHQQLQNQLNFLKKQLEEKKKQKKNLKKQQKILKQQLATFLRNRKEYIKGQQYKLQQQLIQNHRGIANNPDYHQKIHVKLKSAPKTKGSIQINDNNLKKQKNKSNVPSYDVLIGLVSQLDRIKDIVEKQMKDNKRQVKF